MSYRQLLANLEALPEGERQLAAAVYIFRDDDDNDVCGCVLGKGVPAIRAVAERTPSVNEYYGVANHSFDHIDLGGLARPEAIRAQSVNDSFGPDFLSTEDRNAPHWRRDRYAHMIEWLRLRVSEESEAPQAI